MSILCLWCFVLSNILNDVSANKNMYTSDMKTVASVLKNETFGEDKHITDMKDALNSKVDIGIITIVSMIFSGLVLSVLILMALYIVSMRSKLNRNRQTHVELKSLEKYQNSPKGENDKLQNSEKKAVPFHRIIDATLSDTAMDKLRDSMKSVGLLFCNDLPRGTVIRIGPTFVLTAWHVVQPIVSTPGQVDSNGRPVTSMNLNNLKKKNVVYVVFNKNSRNMERGGRFSLLGKLCFLDKHLDVCILELDGISSLLPAPFDVFRDFKSMWNGKPPSKFVHVIGQHPESLSIVLDTGCTVTSKEDTKVKTILKWLKKNTNKVIRNGHTKLDVKECYKFFLERDEYLLHDTFLEFGASGGAVVSFTPEGEVALVGVLIQGLPYWYWNKEGIEVGGYPNKVRLEVAVQISKVLMSNEWRDEEKRRIIGNLDTHIDIEEDMETEDMEGEALDAKIGLLSVND